MTQTTAKIRHRRYSRRDYQAFVYIAPWIIGFLVLQLYPFITSLIYSFCDYRLGSTPKFVGLGNYIRLFTKDADFSKSLRATAIFTLAVVPGKLILSLAVAMFLNRDLKGINLVRTVYYIPSLFGGSVAVSVLWKVLFQDNGIINAYLSALGLQNIQFWGDPNYALGTICSLEIWQFGSSMVMSLAALKQVPASLYEAASIDGATAWHKFWHVTIPQISPVLFFNLIMQTIQALQNFTSASVITNGGPLKSTYVMGMKLYKEAFTNFKMGYASAISWVMFLIIMVVTLLLFRFSSAWVSYDD